MALLDDKSPSMRSQYEGLMQAEQQVNRREVALNHKLHERPLDQSERAELLSHQRRAAEVYQTLSLSPPAPHPNEPPFVYRVRLAHTLKDHSPQWRYTNIYRIAEKQPTVFTNVIEQEIFNAAREHGFDPLDSWRADAHLKLRERIAVDENGARTSVFHGQPCITLSSFNGDNRACAVKGWGPRFPNFRRVK
jgi:hypothetical protein